MSNTLTEDSYRDLKASVEKARSDAERAQGALDQLMVRLKTEFNCKSLREARELLQEVQKERDKADKAFSEAMTDYKKKWLKDE